MGGEGWGKGRDTSPGDLLTTQHHQFSAPRPERRRPPPGPRLSRRGVHPQSPGGTGEGKESDSVAKKVGPAVRPKKPFSSLPPSYDGQFPEKPPPKAGAAYRRWLGRVSDLAEEPSLALEPAVLSVSEERHRCSTTPCPPPLLLLLLLGAPCPSRPVECWRRVGKATRQESRERGMERDLMECKVNFNLKFIL